MEKLEKPFWAEKKKSFKVEQLFCLEWKKKKTFFCCQQKFLQSKGFLWQKKEKFQTKFNLSERFLFQRKVWKLSSFQEQIWSVKLWRHVSFFFQKCVRFWREANLYHRSVNFYYSDFNWGALQTLESNRFEKLFKLLLEQKLTVLPEVEKIINFNFQIFFPKFVFEKNWKIEVNNFFNFW